MNYCCNFSQIRKYFLTLSPMKSISNQQKIGKTLFDKKLQPIWYFLSGAEDELHQRN